MQRDDRYTSVAIALHWTIAALVIANIAIGLLHDDLPKEIGRQAIWWHKSFGITVLLLSIVRILWRVFNRPPPLPAAMRPWDVWTARITHWSLYVLMFALPLTGWIFTSASPRNSPIPFYGLHWPYLPVHNLPMDQRKIISHAWNGYHGILGWIFLALLVLHVSAALKHWLFDRDNVISHMIPAIQPSRPALVGPADKTAD